MHSPFPVDLQSQTPFPASVDTNRNVSSLFKKPNYETQGNRLSFRGICGYATVSWPPVPDVVKRTLGLRAINCSFTDEFMHRNTRRPSRSKALVTSASGARRTGDGGPQQRLCMEGTETKTKTKRGPTQAFILCERGNSFYRKLHRGENSHRCFATSPRGSAQISTANGATRRLRKPPSVRAAGMQTVLSASASVLPSVCAPTSRVTLPHCADTDT